MSDIKELGDQWKIPFGNTQVMNHFHNLKGRSVYIDGVFGEPAETFKKVLKDIDGGLACGLQLRTDRQVMVTTVSGRTLWGTFDELAQIVREILTWEQ